MSPIFPILSFQKPTAFNANIDRIFTSYPFHFSLTFLFKRRIFSYFVSLKFLLRFVNFLFWILSLVKRDSVILMGNIYIYFKEN